MHNVTPGKAITFISMLAITGYAAYRTADLLSNTFDESWRGFAWLAVLVQEVGIMGWLTYRGEAKGQSQRTISIIMVCLNLAGSIAGLFGDTLYHFFINTAKKYNTDIALWAALIVTLVLAANAIAFVLVQLYDPERQTREAENEARALIESETIRRIREQAGLIAGELANAKAQVWKDNMKGSWHAGLNAGESAKPLPAPKPKPTFSADGGGDEEPLNFTQPHRKYHE